jgi:hypothetical protein
MARDEIIAWRLYCTVLRFERRFKYMKLVLTRICFAGHQSSEFVMYDF